MVSLRLSLSRTRLLRNENDVVRGSEGGNEFSQQFCSRTRKVGSESFGEVGRRYFTFQNVEANVGRTYLIKNSGPRIMQFQPRKKSFWTSNKAHRI